MTGRVIFMSIGGDGAEAPCQVYLRDGTLLKPIMAGGSSTIFAVPVAFRNDLLNAGFETSADVAHNRVPQGPTSSRPASPSTNDAYLDWTISRYIYWNGSAWIDTTSGKAV